MSKETIGLPEKKLQLVALVPHFGDDHEWQETLVFTDEHTAMTYWRALPERDRVTYIKMYEDLYSDGWVLSHVKPGG